MQADHSFQEMMQRYNRELVQMRERARTGPESACPEPEQEPEPEAVCARDEPPGPAPVRETALHETLEAFVHAPPLGRVVHTKGYGAIGRFRVYECMGEYTAAPFLQDPSRETPVRARFSLAVGGRGAPDTGRNVRGFSTKFYTGEGNFDLVCNQIPVFFVRDAILFPEVIAALSPSPVNNLAQPERIWSFLARHPEGMHMLTWLYSNVGTLQSFRRMRGYGVNTFVWRNAGGKRRYVKYHWLPLAGEEYLDSRRARELACHDPDLAGRDLYETLSNGGKAEYELCVQLMDPSDAEKLPYDPLDDTKAWSEEEYPLHRVGCMTLDRVPKDYWEEVEKLAFSPANLVDGIELSADRMLQGRSFIYWDAQRRRLGPDFRSIPVNRSAARPWTPSLCGGIGRACDTDSDDFTQAGERYRSLDEAWREQLAENIAADLRCADAQTRACIVKYLHQADHELGARVEEAL